MVNVWSHCLTIIFCVADACFKQSAAQSAFVNGYLADGLLLTGGANMIWIWVYRRAKFATSSSLYAEISIILYVLVGVVVFKEKLAVNDYVGLGLAFVSIYLLSRFM